MVKSRWKTDHLLWIVASCASFAVIGFLNPLAGTSRGDCSLWGSFLDGMDRDGDWVIIGFQSLLCAAPAVILGWPLQAFAVVCGLRLKTQTDLLLASDYDDGPTTEQDSQRGSS